jgi:hypothetical protein
LRDIGKTQETLNDAGCGSDSNWVSAIHEMGLATITPGKIQANHHINFLLHNSYNLSMSAAWNKMSEKLDWRAMQTRGFGNSGLILSREMQNISS